jgi:hypothetical protein
MGVLTRSYNERAVDIDAYQAAQKEGRDGLKETLADFEALAYAYSTAGIPATIEVSKDSLVGAKADIIDVKVSGFPMRPDSRDELEFSMRARIFGADKDEPGPYKSKFNVTFDRLMLSAEEGGTGEYYKTFSALDPYIQSFLRQIEGAVGGLSDAQITAVSHGLDAWAEYQKQLKEPAGPGLPPSPPRLPHRL